MSTTAPPPTVQPPSAPTASREVIARSARAMLARREDPRTQVVRLLVVAIAAVVLAMGWRVTDIDLGKLTNAANAGPILGALVRPDVVTREVTTTELRTPFRVGSGPDTPSMASTSTGQTLSVTPGAVQGGQEVTFAGRGFAPSSEGTLTLEFSASRGRKISTVQTDASGAFELAFAWPGTIDEGDYTVQLVMNAPTGRLLASETLLLSFGRIGETILLALMGTVFGVLLSIPLSFLGARNLMGGSLIGLAVYSAVRTFFTITRSIEVLIVGLIMVVIVGIGSYAGVLAIVVHSIGSLGKLYSEAIESIDPGPVEAITATGASRIQTVLAGVVPQVIPEFLAVTIYWWDHNVRMSTVLGLVGGGGIGYLLVQYINLLQYHQAATVLWLIVMVVMVMDYASAAIRARLV